MIKKFLFIFIASFLLNLIWENAQAPLYLHYQGHIISEYTLLRAALFDAVLTTAIFLIIIKLPAIKNKLAWVMTVCLVSAISIELYALATNRWAYNQTMPIIPGFNVGLSPIIQLPLLALIVYYLTKNYQKTK